LITRGLIPHDHRSAFSCSGPSSGRPVPLIVFNWLFSCIRQNYPHYSVTSVFDNLALSQHFAPPAHNFALSEFIPAGLLYDDAPADEIIGPALECDVERGSEKYGFSRPHSSSPSTHTHEHYQLAGASLSQSRSKPHSTPCFGVSKTAQMIANEDGGFTFLSAETSIPHACPQLTDVQSQFLYADKNTTVMKQIKRNKQRIWSLKLLNSPECDVRRKCVG